MRMTFLGTGGGRFATVRQTRWTGGLYIQEKGQNIHVDPGPGGLVNMRKLDMDPQKTDLLFVSHRHPDHCTDVEIMIVAMTAGIRVPHGMLLGSQSVIEGMKDESPTVSPYLQKKLKTNLVMFPGDKVSKNGISITAKPAYHSDPSTIGFILEGDRTTLGYIPDTDYHKSLDEEYKDCDVLVASLTRPRKSRVPFHLSTEDVRKIIEGASPKEVFLTHFGERMLRQGPEKESAWLEDKTGVKTHSATDGMVVEIGNGFSIIK